MAIETLEEIKVNIRHCPMYKVVMLDDDKTPMDFVVDTLMSIFRMAKEQAIQAMLVIHNDGQEVVGVYPLEQAEFKVDQTHSLARARNFPLTCIIEKVI